MSLDENGVVAGEAWREGAVGRWQDGVVQGAGDSLEELLEAGREETLLKPGASRNNNSQLIVYFIYIFLRKKGFFVYRLRTFHQLGPTALGRVGHRVAMSVLVCVCAIGCSFFLGLSTEFHLGLVR